MTGAFLMAAGGGPAPLVMEIALCFIGAGVLALICQRIGLPSIAGFILAGIIIGPIGIGLVEDRSSIETIANLGLVFLLFLIGLEIDIRALAASGRTLLVTGLAQVPIAVVLCALIFTGVASMAPALGLSGYAPLYLGLSIAFSSTLLVVKTLHDRAAMDSLDGRLCLGILVFQDIWAIVVLAMQPNLANPQITPIAGTFLGVMLVVGVAVLVARFALPAAFRLVAKSPELVVTLSLGWCFSLGVFGSQLGTIAHALHLGIDPTVSMELGALVAGASIASLPYTHEVAAKVGNLRDFFITLFFVALGMSIPVPDGPLVLVLALVTALVAVLVRALVFYPLLRGSGLDTRHSISTSVKLAQVSEFALVMVYVGYSLGHVDGRFVSIIIFAFVITAVATPFLFDAADPLQRRIMQMVSGGVPEKDADGEGDDDEGARIVLLGFHRLASSLLHDIKTLNPELAKEMMIVDFNVGLHDAIRATGAKVMYGDIASTDTLAHAKLEHAQVIVSTIPDELLKGVDNVDLARVLRKLAPKAKLVMQATRLDSAAELREAGADHVFAMRTETSRSLLPALQAALNGEFDTYLHDQEDRGTLDARDEILR